MGSLLSAIRPLYSWVYRFCLRLLGEAMLAEDAFQDAWVRVFEHRRELRGENFRAWLFWIAYRGLLRPSASVPAGWLGWGLIPQSRCPVLFRPPWQGHTRWFGGKVLLRQAVAYELGQGERIGIEIGFWIGGSKSVSFPADL
ncbi:MAG: RNA polymerase sigma factor [Candidatus Kapabacteria bacterium]|nr:RNA polymerase sigma factor [Candidatus Kapabacteria bacterium]MCS7170251.1 RNA polymerase sigma factor [Candidatus Kapabacteria bacterium]MDW7996184.1 RNA polymerase sigma factor [Bacteroidota bacterium]